MNIKRVFFFLFLAPALVVGEEKAIGYIQLPTVKKQNITQIGTPKPVVIGNQQGEVWYDEESYSSSPKQFDVFADPTKNSKKLVSVDVTGAMMEILAETAPGIANLNTISEQNKYEKGKSKLIVFEKKEGWAKIKFLKQPPWNGRYGWIELCPNSGGFVSY